MHKLTDSLAEVVTQVTRSHEYGLVKAVVCICFLLHFSQMHTTCMRMVVHIISTSSHVHEPASGDTWADSTDAESCLCCDNCSATKVLHKASILFKTVSPSSSVGYVTLQLWPTLGLHQYGWVHRAFCPLASLHQASECCKTVDSMHGLRLLLMRFSMPV